MKQLLIPSILLICIITVSFTFAQKITLHEFNQSESLTSCTQGLISGMDSFVFKSEVDIADDPNSTTIFYQIKKQQDQRYKSICNINIIKECNGIYNHKMCQCYKISNTFLVININFKANFSLNGALIKGTVVRSIDHEPVRSKEQTFPAIYASTNTKWTLKINNKVIEGSHDLVVPVTENNLVVDFTCNSPAGPCLTEVSTNESTYKVLGRDKTIYYSPYNISQTLTVIIKSAACRLDGNVNVLKQKIQIELDHKVEEEPADLLPYVIALASICLLTLIIVIMLSFYRRKRKYLKNVPNSIKHETGQNKENDQQSVCLENRSPCQQGSSGDGEHLNLLAVSDNDTELKSTDSDEENHPIPIQESRSPKLCTAEEPMAEEPVINDDENEKEGKLQNNVGDNIKLQSTFSNTDNEYSFSPVSDWFSTNDHHQKQHKEKSSMYSTQRIKLKHQNKRTNFESLSKLEDNFKNEGSSSLQKRTKKRKVIHSDDFDEAEQFGFVVDSKQNFSDYYTKVLQKRYQEIMELLIKDVDDESHKKNILQETLKMSKEYDLSDITTILTKIRDAIILKFENVNV